MWTQADSDTYPKDLPGGILLSTYFHTLTLGLQVASLLFFVFSA